MKINNNYKSLEESYLFSTISKKINEYIKFNPDCKIIRMGIGDVTRPLCESVVAAFEKAVAEQSKLETFHGYGPEQGYDFLREKIKSYYKLHGVDLLLDEIFVSDGAKSDLGNILDLFDNDNIVLIPNPVYPVYCDTNHMLGRKIEFMNANINNNFLPLPNHEKKVDIIYLCSPNNPTGACYNKTQLKEWVDYANKNDSIILYDAAYEAFVSDKDIPRSIYEIDDAKKCAIEFCSLSKTAGFTGVRCGYTIVPKDLIREGMSLSKMWLRRQTTKFNGVSYPVQRAAQAVFTEKGQEECKHNIDIYMKNAKLISDTLTNLGIWHTGGKNSPYIWLKCPWGMTSWEFFDFLLENAGVVGTPGSGFGTNGEGFFRLTSFATEESTKDAMDRIKKAIKEKNI